MRFWAARVAAVWATCWWECWPQSGRRRGWPVTGSASGPLVEATPPFHSPRGSMSLSPLLAASMVDKSAQSNGAPSWSLSPVLRNQLFRPASSNAGQSSMTITSSSSPSPPPPPPPLNAIKPAAAVASSSFRLHLQHETKPAGCPKPRVPCGLGCMPLSCPGAAGSPCKRRLYIPATVNCLICYAPLLSWRCRESL